MPRTLTVIIKKGERSKNQNLETLQPVKHSRAQAGNEGAQAHPAASWALGETASRRRPRHRSRCARDRGGDSLVPTEAQRVNGA